MRRYKERSRYRTVVSVTVQGALIKVSQPIARGERDGSNQRSPTQSPIAVSKPNFVGCALPRRGLMEPSTLQRRSGAELPVVLFPSFSPNRPRNPYLVLARLLQSAKTIR